MAAAMAVSRQGSRQAGPTKIRVGVVWPRGGGRGSDNGSRRGTNWCVLVGAHVESSSASTSGSISLGTPSRSHVGRFPCAAAQAAIALT